MVGTVLLTLDALASERLCLLNSWVVCWAFNVAAKATKENFVELGENARTLCHHAFEVDQLLQVDLSQVAKFIFEGDVTDAYKKIMHENNRHENTIQEDRKRAK